MPLTLTWYGHATWMVATEAGKILVDPFFNDNPKSPVSADQIEADLILVSHGHFDHIADAAAIASRTGASIVANFEIAEWFANNHGIENRIGMNIGGQYRHDLATIKMTHALHSSQLPDGSYGGNPGGWLLTIGDQVVYFACDTGLFSDMRRIGDAGIDVAIVPIGDLFTMGPEDSIQAIQMVRAKHVVPAHYDTWPPIEQDAEQWARRVHDETDSKPIVLRPGESHEF